MLIVLGQCPPTVTFTFFPDRPLLCTVPVNPGTGCGNICLAVRIVCSLRHLLGCLHIWGGCRELCYKYSPWYYLLMRVKEAAYQFSPRRRPGLSILPHVQFRGGIQTYATKSVAGMHMVILVVVCEFSFNWLPLVV